MILVHPIMIHQAIINMHLQTLTKKIYLNEGWKDNNYKGYIDYIVQAKKVAEAVVNLFLSKEVEIIGIVNTVEITIKQKEKSDAAKVPDLSSSFWVDYATGKVDA